ncbi:putative signal peptide protein [Puccinia sorghi]|uniref:Putative signal peptide protein n=1 Tax=Puccinia sorghi TaxID=27349 RepID=A0A0L6VBC1_9BASI|nr:putative signal peptide protein [Puccinia sorghi]
MIMFFFAPLDFMLVFCCCTFGYVIIQSESICWSFFLHAY